MGGLFAWLEEVLRPVVDWWIAHFPIREPVVLFAVSLGLFLVVPLLSARLKIPSIVGILFCGIVLGPHALGVLGHQEDGALYFLGHLGLLFIMFLAGLEMDVDDFKKNRGRGLTFGFLSFIFPLAAGTGIAVALHDHLGWERYSWRTALLLGSLLASHTLIAYPITSRLGISRQEAVTVAVGGTVITDTAALLLLAILPEAENGVGVWFWVGLLVPLAIFVAVLFLVIPRLGRWFFRSVGDDGGHQFLFVLAVAFVGGALSHLVHLEPIIGTFLAGLAINRLIPEQSTLMNRINFVGNQLFVPFFLLYVGTLVDLQRLFEGWGVAGLAGLLLAGTLATKYLAAFLLQKSFGYTRYERGVVFGLSVPKAAALAIALIGFEKGLFDQSVLDAGILLLLGTCLIGPWITEHYARLVAQHRVEEGHGGDAAQRILVPMANPATAHGIMEMAFLLRHPQSHEPLFPLAVVGDEGDVDRRVAASEKMLSESVISAAAADVPISPLVRIDLNVPAGVGRAVREQRITTVLVGWSGEATATTRMFGSALDKILVHCESRVLVYRSTHAAKTTKVIRIAIPPYAEHEPRFEETLYEIKNLAKQIGGEVIVYLTEIGEASLPKRIEQAKPALTVETRADRNWAATRKRLLAETEAGDMVILFSAREATVSWQPGLDRMPRLLAQTHEDLSLLVVYPPLPSHDQEQAVHAHLQQFLTSAPKIEARRIGSAVEDWKDFVARVVEALSLPRATVRERLAELIVAEAEAFTTDLGAGMALVHAHTEDVDRPLIMAAVLPEGIEFPHVGDRCRILFLLLSPSTLLPERHLRNLSRVAYWSRTPRIAQRLLVSEGDEDIVRILSELRPDARGRGTTGEVEGRARGATTRDEGAGARGKGGDGNGNGDRDGGKAPRR